LPVLDFLDLAIGHSAYYLEQDSSGNLKSFVDGVKLAYGEFVKVLRNYGAEAIETSGKNFDANFHEAVEMVEDSGQPDGKIIEEKRKGYVYKERLLRPSMVSIAKSKN
jgi:molecular chaperone GrpE